MGHDGVGSNPYGWGGVPANNLVKISKKNLSLLFVSWGGIAAKTQTST